MPSSDVDFKTGARPIIATVLASGSPFGPYEIVGLIGAGGMGEVYRARDSRLQRHVALKILPEGFATDPERVARFQREAQVLASLNHPHIAAIHGFEESGDVRALVLELVEGDTLADRLATGPMPIDEALSAATQIAEALQFAHEQGIIHRDLKPANVKITSDGTVKVLDFGLAKLAQAPNREASGPRPQATDLTLSPTITSPAAMTGVGVLLGTAAYMSPEQAKGREADKRSDIWAFGCVLFEMVSGRRPFEGDDVGDTLAAVIRGEPDWTRLPPALPRAVRTVIERCLAKDRRKRLADIAVAEFLLTEPTSPSRDAADTIEAGRQLWKRIAPVAAAIVLTAGVTAAIAWRLRTDVPRPVIQFSIPAQENASFTSGQPVDISPDGSQIVYAANLQLYRRSLAETESRPIPGTSLAPSTTRFPVFSPDGRSIAFWSQGDRTLKKIPATGGVAVTLCELPFFPMGLSWDEDWIVIGQQGGVSRVSPNGGTPERIVTTKPDERVATPRLLPGGRVVLFTLARGVGADMWDTAEIVAQDLTSGERKVVIRGGSDARYVPTGHLLYSNAGVVRAIPFDVDRLEATGEPTPVIVGVQRFSARSFSQLNAGSSYYSFSDTGALIYVPGPATASVLNMFALVDRDGTTKPLGLQPGTYGYPRVSPDATRVVYGTDDGKEADIWLYQLSGESQPRRLTFGGLNRFPIWSADGRRVVYQSNRGGDSGLWWQHVDGGAAERLTQPDDKDVTHIADSFSPDGKSLAFTANKDSRGRPADTIWILSIADKKLLPLRTESASVSRAAFSPDGRWLAYQSADVATAGVLIEPFPQTGAVNHVGRRAVGTPHHPFWSRDGKELFYLPGPNLFASMRVTTQPEFSVGNPVPLERGVFLEGGPQGVRNMDILPDGRFFVVIDASQTAEGESAPINAQGDRVSTRINVVLNWHEELKRLAPAR